MPLNLDAAREMARKALEDGERRHGVTDAWINLARTREPALASMLLEAAEELERLREGK